MAEKIKAANLLSPRYGEHRKILVDNLEGDFHRAYGAMPNVVYIVDVGLVSLGVYFVLFIKNN